MSIPETKELKAEWKAETVLPEYTLKDVAAHNTKGDTWMVIHGQGIYHLQTKEEEEEEEEEEEAKLTLQQSSISQNTFKITLEVQRPSLR